MPFATVSDGTRLYFEELGTWAAAHPEYVAQSIQRFEHPIPEYAQVLHYRASEGHDTWDLLPKFTSPTLVIHGRADRVNPTANLPEPETHKGPQARVLCPYAPCLDHPK